MWATYWDAFAEAGGRRIVLILAAVALGLGLLFSLPVTFGTVNGVPVIFQGPLSMGPWPLAVPVILAQLTAPLGISWLLLMIFTGCPQFVSMLERGWRELTFSKATPRWQILLGRYLSTTTLFSPWL
jgi:ABC-type transport system involved in multi-copper enzyme maturation permease subunit